MTEKLSESDQNKTHRVPTKADSQAQAADRPFRNVVPAEKFRKLTEKLDFLLEIEKLKLILRRNYILNGVRRENDAEHSWHISVMSLLFFEDAADPSVDLLRVLKMLLLHDLVEIDAGDTYAFDQEGHKDKAEREQRAADRLFAILPGELGRSLREYWEEFEAAETPDAKFALALDRLQPMLQNYLFEGNVWKKNGIRPEQVAGRLGPVREAIPMLGELADLVIEDAKENGFFPERTDFS